MKLDCKVIEDLLPLYHDKVCSPESSLLVAEHLSECQSCKNFLSALDVDINTPQEPEDDKKVLEKISRRWKQATRKALLRGAALALAAVLVLTALGGGFWYGTQAARYQDLAAKMEVPAQFPHESSSDGEPEAWVFPKEYSLFQGGYHFWLRLPGFLDFYGGVVSIYPDKAHQHWAGTGLRPHVSLGVKFRGDEAYYIILIDVDGEYQSSFCIDSELKYIEGNDRESVDLHRQLLEEYRPEIQEIVQAAKDMWDLP